MDTKKVKMIYNLELFNQFCKDKNIELLKDYSNINMTSNTIIEAKCNNPGCNENVNKTFMAMYLYNDHCKTCTNKETIQKYEKTCLEKFGCKNAFQNSQIKNKIKDTILQNYGTDNPSKSEAVREKYRQTCLEKYGCENTFQNEECKRKIKETFLQKYGTYNPTSLQEVQAKRKTTSLEKYGCENVLQNEEIKNKIKNTNLQKYGCEIATQNPTVINKMKNTNIEKYGCENTFQVQEFKDKSKETLMERYGVQHNMHSTVFKNKMKETTFANYGVEYASQSQEIKDKIKKTCLEKFGVEYSLQSEEVKAKGVATNIIRYGANYPMQNAEIAESCSKKAYAKKEYTFPSGKTIDVQGYENYAIDDLLNTEKIDENDIITSRREVPEIWYNDKEGIKRRHFVDIFIPSQNRCVEVKSTWTMEKNREKVFQKQDAAKTLDYQYDIWVYDNGKLLESY
jgi:hypothetical protein